MSDAKLSLEELASAFSRLGVKDPEAWACSEIKEGIPQLAIALFLKSACKPIEELRSSHALSDLIPRAHRRESAEALKRMVDSGVAKSDVLQLVRQALYGYLTELCFLLDDIAFTRIPDWPYTQDFGNVGWTLFSVDSEGKPQASMSGLHEVVGEFLNSKP